MTEEEIDEHLARTHPDVIKKILCHKCGGAVDNSLQQLKAEIASLVTKWDALKSDGIVTPRVMYHNFLFEVMNKLRQLSAV